MQDGHPHIHMFGRITDITILTIGAIVQYVEQQQTKANTHIITLVNVIHVDITIKIT